jgi:hypothetical protein
MWKAVKRSYHGADEVHRPWIVIQEGETRGICECWKQRHAEIIADAMNIREKVAEKVLINAIFQPLETSENGREKEQKTQKENKNGTE